jgi:phosphopantothenoylcysteine decarboxylase/phosphopantothenate--cysteine ligase
VADFAPQTESNEKIKKQDGQSELTLHLVTTPDIAKALGETKKPEQQLIGFALETQHEKENALRKLERKHMDAIVLNSLRDSGAGFGVDTNRVTILRKDGNSFELPLQSKADVADRIVELSLIS